MADEQDLDRNEAATPHKLEKAKEKGQVSKSADVISALVWMVAVVYFTWQGWGNVVRLFQFDHAILVQAASMGSTSTAWPLISRMLIEAMVLLLPFFCTLVCAAIIANVIQTGIVLSADPVIADFERINPVNGFKKVFSMRTLFDLGRACVKLAVLLGVAYYALKDLTVHFYSVASLSALEFLRTMFQDLASLGLKMGLILLLIAAIDWAYTKHEFNKKMRMSQREQKDENKNREGDPRIRARLRELRREAFRRMLSLRQTKNADVLLTNPTHFAVALRYAHGQMDSPQLISKGSGHVAAVMRSIAQKHQIPIVENPVLARKLFHELEVDQHVPSSSFADVARIIVWVFEMKKLKEKNSQLNKNFNRI
jgi:flagellar biosynthesis protein FlhB